MGGGGGWRLLKGSLFFGWWEGRGVRKLRRVYVAKSGSALFLMKVLGSGI